jgi:hypothetical protein
MNNIEELIKTNPDAFDYPDCRVGGGYSDEMRAEVEKNLPDFLKQSPTVAKAKEPEQQPA